MQFKKWRLPWVRSPRDKLLSMLKSDGYNELYTTSKSHGDLPNLYLTKDFGKRRVVINVGQFNIDVSHDIRVNDVYMSFTPKRSTEVFDFMRVSSMAMEETRTFSHRDFSKAVANILSEEALARMLSLQNVNLVERDRAIRDYYNFAPDQRIYYNQYDAEYLGHAARFAMAMYYRDDSTSRMTVLRNVTELAKDLTTKGGRDFSVASTTRLGEFAVAFHIGKASIYVPFSSVVEKYMHDRGYTQRKLPPPPTLRPYIY